MTLEHCLEWSMLGYYTVRTYISWLGNRRNTKDNPFSFSFVPFLETIWKVNSDLCRRNEPTKHGQSPDGTPADAPAADGAPADGPPGPADGPSGPTDDAPAHGPPGPTDDAAADGPPGPTNDAPADGPPGPADGPSGPANGTPPTQVLLDRQTGLRSHISQFQRVFHTLAIVLIHKCP